MPGRIAEGGGGTAQEQEEQRPGGGGWRWRGLEDSHLRGKCNRQGAGSAEEDNRARVEVYRLVVLLVGSVWCGGAIFFKKSTPHYPTQR